MNQSHCSDRSGEHIHQLQLRGVTCNHDGNGHVQSAHDGHDAGRGIKVGAASAVGSSEQMLCSSGRQRTPGSTHIAILMLLGTGKTNLVSLLLTQPAHGMAADSASLAG